MQKQVIQAALVLGILTVPAFASAEGLLSSTVKTATGAVKSVTTEVVGVSAEKEDSAMEEKQAAPIKKESTSQNALNKTVSSVTESLSTTADKVTDSLSDGKPLVDLNLSKNLSLKVNAGAVNADLSKNPSVKVETGIADANLSEKSSVKVNTGTIKADVSEEPSFKIDTKVIQADVSKEPSIKIDTKMVQAEVNKDKVSVNPAKPDIPVKEEQPKNEADQAPVKDEPAQAPAEPKEMDMKETIEKETSNSVLVAAKPEASKKPAAAVPAPVKKINSQTEPERAKITAKPSEKSPVKIGKGTEAPANGPPEMVKEKLTAITVSQSAPSSSAMTGGSSAGAGFNAVGMLNPMQEEFIFADPVQNGQEKRYYDQWLNAPPAQPPQSSLLLTKSI
ncbi:hypothetical protein CEF21_20005 [Bacillus sp. FJAT-42376]|uniref:hypothetical protein n=1 Tax=Bacillus sp. FJAT-42376 TaxID=2014076 RepID=UPI000F516511|nr:hypothetical protein [Bacillus sp. FJAT-42376]AZB44392.1 hypothetical protein CEF21_20005 [Bacillus sp. FJAT-42376]